MKERLRPNKRKNRSINNSINKRRKINEYQYDETINDYQNNDDQSDEIDGDDDIMDDDYDSTELDNVDLPEKWSDEIGNNILKQISSSDKKRLDENYKRAKNIMYDNMPTLYDILNLNNITDIERAGLLEKWSIFKSLEGNVESYFKYGQYLKKMIRSFMNSNETIEEKQKYYKLKEELSIYDVSMTDLETKILTRNLNKYQMGIIYSKYIKLKEMSPTDNEYFKLKQWIEYALEIPFNDIKSVYMFDKLGKLDSKQINSYLSYVQKELDKKIYGMTDIKEEILYILNNKITNKNSTDSNLALVGKAGTGKTMIVRALAEILDLPFEQISLGGLNDSSFLDGHSYTYEGARPGKIVDVLRKMRYKTGIIYFDEIDKIAKTKGGLEVSNLLLHIIDFTQNRNFCDKYFPELDIDLSNIWFIFSLNNQDDVDPILLNRMNLVTVQNYNLIDKVNIVRDYLLPLTLKNAGMQPTDIKIEDQDIEHIILKAKSDDGIRELKRNIEKIIKRINIMRSSVLSNGTFGDLKLSFTIGKFKIPMELKKNHIDKLLS